MRRILLLHEEREIQPCGPAADAEPEEATLTGSTTGPDGGQVPIKDGKVEGNTISFGVTLDFGGMALDLSYKGVVKGNEIQITGEFAGMPFEFMVKKA